jgi:hypothetical protein
MNLWRNAVGLLLGFALSLSAGAQVISDGDGLLFAGTAQTSFEVPFNDIGSGAVDTNPTKCLGSCTATFTRATVAWTKLSTGLWTQVASGTARSLYLGANTAVGTYGGYFAEGAGTQLVTPTASIRDMTNASWVKVNVTAAKTATGIDGAANSASTLTATANGGTILQTLIAVGSSRTYSLFLRRKTGTGTITIQQGATTLDVTAQLNSSTYTRVQLNANVLNAAYGIIFGTNTDAVEADFNQFEAGTFATSPMATAGAARNNDVLTYTSSGNINGTAGTIYLEMTTAENGTANDRAFISRGLTGGAAFGIVAGAGGSLGGFDGTSALTFGVGVGLPQTTIAKVAMNWGGANRNGWVNGTTGTPGAFDGDFNFAASFSVGRDEDNLRLLYGTIRNVRIWPVALPAWQLINKTTASDATDWLSDPMWRMAANDPSYRLVANR